jgi:hypothetical protein
LTRTLAQHVLVAVERDRSMRALVRIDPDDHFSHDILHLDQGMTAAGMSDFRSIAPAPL